MPPEIQQFDIALGHCTVRDGVLVVDRSDPDEMGRWEVFRNGLRRGMEYRPWITGVWIVGSLLLGLVFLVLLVDIYASNPAVAPLVGLLAILGVLAVTVPLEVSYRRAMRQRRRLRTTLADEFHLVDADRVPLDDVTGVTVRSVSTGSLLGDGSLVLVHFRHDGDGAATYLGFPGFMTGERATARDVFERYGIDVTDER